MGFNEYYLIQTLFLPPANSFSHQTISIAQMWLEIPGSCQWKWYNLRMHLGLVCIFSKFFFKQQATLFIYKWHSRIFFLSQKGQFCGFKKCPQRIVYLFWSCHLDFIPYVYHQGILELNWKRGTCDSPELMPITWSWHTINQGWVLDHGPS